LDRIDDALRLLAEHPSAGQVTDQGDMRRRVVNPYPYVIFYRISADEVVIHSVRHAARLRSG
jgi:plasmid stabilization system protein ParE